jgi:plasmid stabilization system protein ParE
VIASRYGIFRSPRPRVSILRRVYASASPAIMPSIYLHDERELVIVRVLHGARDAAALAEHGGFAIPDERGGV